MHQDAQDTLVCRRPVQLTTSAGAQLDMSPSEGQTIRCRFNVPTCPGCPDSLDGPDARDIALHRLLLARPVSDVYTLSSPIRSPMLYRHQLITSFVEKFFPSGVLDMRDVVPKLWQWVAPRGRAMSAATDAVLLVQQGVACKDDRLLMEGRTRHGMAVQLLRRLIEDKGSAAASDDGVLGAIAVLGVASLYTTISCDGWRLHSRGLCALLRTRDPRTMKTPFSASLIQGCKPIALMDTLMTRKACLFGEPRWIAAARSTSTRHVAELSNLAMRVPAMLEQADKLVRAKPSDVYVIATALTCFVELERELMDCRLQWYRNSTFDAHSIHTSRKSGLGAQPLRTVGIERYPAFLERFANLASAFSTVIQYSSFAVAAWHEYYWTCLMALREAILDVSRLQPQPLLRPTDQDAVLTAAVYECADSLCQAVPFMRENYANCMSSVLAISAPFQLTSKWYEKQGDVAKLAWCRAMEEDLDMGPLNVPYVQQNSFIVDGVRFARWMTVL